MEIFVTMLDHMSNLLQLQSEATGANLEHGACKENSFRCLTMCQNALIFTGRP